mmetsp:Transcript_32194/g.63854  ORF Transcript_32194/g.63854 Transcript_32194/m.63854 type:complete len:227 (+) Transcript_32194:1169-1849(+)
MNPKDRVVSGKGHISHVSHHPQTVQREVFRNDLTVKALMGSKGIVSVFVVTETVRRLILPDGTIGRTLNAPSRPLVNCRARLTELRNLLSTLLPGGGDEEHPGRHLESQTLHSLLRVPCSPHIEMRVGMQVDVQARHKLLDSSLVKLHTPILSIFGCLGPRKTAIGLESTCDSTGGVGIEGGPHESIGVLQLCIFRKLNFPIGTCELAILYCPPVVRVALPPKIGI